MSDEQSGPDFIAWTDQEAKLMSEFAKVLGNYFMALIVQGIPEDSAIKLVRDYQQHKLDGAAEE